MFIQASPTTLLTAFDPQWAPSLPSAGLRALGAQPTIHTSTPSAGFKPTKIVTRLHPAFVLERASAKYDKNLVFWFRRGFWLKPFLDTVRNNFVTQPPCTQIVLNTCIKDDDGRKS